MSSIRSDHLAPAPGPASPGARLRRARRPVASRCRPLSPSADPIPDRGRWKTTTSPRSRALAFVRGFAPARVTSGLDATPLLRWHRHPGQRRAADLSPIRNADGDLPASGGGRPRHSSWGRHWPCCWSCSAWASLSWFRTEPLPGLELQPDLRPPLRTRARGWRRQPTTSEPRWPPLAGATRPRRRTPAGGDSRCGGAGGHGDPLARATAAAAPRPRPPAISCLPSVRSPRPRASHPVAEVQRAGRRKLPLRRRLTWVGMRDASGGKSTASAHAVPALDRVVQGAALPPGGADAPPASLSGQQRGRRGGAEDPRPPARALDVPLVGDFHYNGHKLLTDNPACAGALDKYASIPATSAPAQARPQFAAIVDVACR